MPPADPVPDWERLVGLLGADLAERARATGALQRRRRVPSAAVLLRLLLAYCAAGWSLRLTAAWAQVVGGWVLSETALRKRLRRAQTWVGELVARQVAVEAVPRPGRVRLIDATVVSGPGSRGTDWRGHLSWDLAARRVVGLELTDGAGGETLARHAVAAEEIAVADGGYCHQRGVGDWLGRGGRVVVRYTWQTLPLYEPAGGEPCDLPAWLDRLPAAGPAERRVELRSAAGVFGVRLVACRLSQEAADRARQKVRRQAQKKGRTPSARSLHDAGFVVLVTNLPAHAWSAAEVLALYRLRWQVELVFKRLKGLWEFDAGRACGSLGAVYLLGTLLQALLAAAWTRPWPDPCLAWLASVARPLSLWRWEALVRLSLRQAILGHLSGDALRQHLPALQRHLCDSPRRRLQQATYARTWLATRPLAHSPPAARA